MMRFNGINPSEISPKIFVSHEIISSIPPREVRLVSSQTQAYLAGVNLSPREVHLHLNFAGRNIDNANELARRAAALFARTDLSEYEPSHMPGKALSVILESASDPEWHWGFGVIEYIFKAPRPFYHSTAETIVIGGRSVYIEPRGSVPCAPEIMHTMEAEADALEITAGGATIMRIRDPYGGKLSAGFKITVDFANRKVSIGNESAMDYVDYTVSDWHPYIIGGALIGTGDAGETKVRWRDEWM